MAIGEGLMRPPRQGRHRQRAAADGVRRWDRAYLLILGWGAAIDPPPAPSTSARREQEVEHDGGLRARVEPAPGAGPDDRAAARAAARPSTRSRRGAGEREGLPR